MDSHCYAAGSAISVFLSKDNATIELSWVAGYYAFMKNYQRGFIGTTVVSIGVLLIIGLGVWWYMNTITNTPAGPVPATTDTEDSTSMATTTNTNTMTTNEPAAPSNTQTLPGGLIVQDVNVGTGAEATAGHKITVHYVGTLDNGSTFDSSRTRGTPFTFGLGAGQVIKGWDEGFAGMKIGGVRKLTIPPALGYGAQAVGPIPPNSTLHFEVELLGVE